jgi:hypothetical protein
VREKPEAELAPNWRHPECGLSRVRDLAHVLTRARPANPRSGAQDPSSLKAIRMTHRRSDGSSAVAALLFSRHRALDLVGGVGKIAREIHQLPVLVHVENVFDAHA